MGVALLIVSIGGVMMGIRTTFDPLLGSQRLIFAFEAVIIGGMGSSWGTLLGGIILGLAPDSWAPRRSARPGRSLSGTWSS